jgi:UDP-glucose 4,6-dehydratase
MASAPYKPTNILITGGAGFIASHVVVRLVTQHPEYNIVSLDKLDYCSSLKNVEHLNAYKNYFFVKGDIQSSDLIQYVLKTHNIDTIMHFAAQTHVDNSFGNSIRVTENNILGTHVLLETAKAHKIKRFIHVSTDEVYGEIFEHEPDAHEESTLAPTNPYAATKAGAEFLVKAYHKSFGVPTIITRGNNVYGPHQFPEKLIPKFICRLMKDMPCCLHGDGSSRRMFLYVEDVAAAFDTILHKGEIGEIYNIGSSDEYTVLQVAKKLLELMGKPADFMTLVENRAFNDCRYAVDSSKLHALGWRPVITWEEGLKRTIEWYKKNSGNWSNVAEALAPHPSAGGPSPQTN